MSSHFVFSPSTVVSSSLLNETLSPLRLSTITFFSVTLSTCPVNSRIWADAEALQTIEATRASNAVWPAFRAACNIESSPSCCRAAYAANRLEWHDARFDEPSSSLFAHTPRLAAAVVGAGGGTRTHTAT